MKDTLRLAVLPLIGGLLLYAAWWWASEDIHLLREGVREQGQIRAVLKIRENSFDLINSLESHVVLLAGNGNRYEFSALNYQQGPLTLTTAEGHSKVIDIPNDLQKEMMEITTKEGKSGINRIIERESKKAKDASRIVGIEKKEIAHGWFEMPARPASYETDGHLVTAVTDASGQPVPARFRQMTVVARFGSLVDQSKLEKTSLVPAPDFESYADGEAFDYAELRDKREKDFALYQESYFGEIRPVALYTHQGQPYVMLSNIGQLRNQMPAFKLFDPCRIALREGRPDTAIMLLDYDAIADSSELITWLSAIAGALFSRWMYPFIALLAGLTCIVGGLVFLSLAIHPHPESGFHRKKTAEKNPEAAPEGHP